MYNGLPTIDDVDVTGKRVLLRIAADVPLATNARGVVEITDDTRLRAVLPTIRYLLEKQCSIVCCGGWLGRPKGMVDPALRMDPVAKRLSELLNVQVGKLDDCIGEAVERAVTQLQPGEIVLLENTRFHAEESANDAQFAKALASLGEVCVFDAFAQAHREHASTTGLVRSIPTVLGLQIVSELTSLEKVTHEPARPFIVVLGGAKITDKMALLRSLIDSADKVLIGGAIANTFLKSQGIEVGVSRIDSVDVDKTGTDPLALAREIIERAGSKLLLPIDLIAGNDANAPTITSIINIGQTSIEKTMGFYDIGPATEELYSPILSSAKTIFWNGLIGVSETPAFRAGTVAIASLMAKNKQAVTVVGGGDTAGAVQELNMADKFTHVSTGGGASLVIVGGGELAALRAMKEQGHFAEQSPGTV